jgi:DNA-binding CsgD family transcriptional regulator
MPVPSPYQIVLSDEEEAVLAARARSARGQYRDRLRARIVLAAAAGKTNATIAAQAGVHVDTVRKWRRRFAAARLAGLKDAPVLDLYAGIWDGQPLTGNDYVICADEKTSIQARCRCHPTLPPGKARAMRVEHDYKRRSAVAYLAAWDVHRAQVTGRCEHTTGIAPFARLVEEVMTTEPYASADRVFWIVDNGSSHRGAASVRRMARVWPNAHLIHLPVHASWLDQAEIYFSVVQRKALTPNDFTSTSQIRDQLAAFETRYNAIARPFNWKFTRTDLNDLLHRIDAHDKTQPHAQAA